MDTTERERRSGRAEMQPGQNQKQQQIWGRDQGKSSGVVWAMVILCTLLAIGVIVTGATVFAVYLLYKPKMPYLLVSDARLVALEYDQAGTIQNLVLSLTIQAENSNSKADASFSRVNLAVGFHGAEVAVLRASPFVVARRSSVPLRYQVVSAGRPLSPDGMRYMDGALKAGVVPLDLFGKARTTWKVGIFVSLRFWTRISCRFLFFFPGNGTAMPIDCRSRSP
ncbi:uncharacterized protein LOC133926024 [Phragmites australis]|uniref:uncharacterized protein LOC133926024 n=1 Tax=Phragmites australis TaxID=29695 RepID=UPI002D7749A7|nr:uncharacterized protein LOC133926024 [Phragmites australis]